MAVLYFLFFVFFVCLTMACVFVAIKTLNLSSHYEHDFQYYASQDFQKEARKYKYAAWRYAGGAIFFAAMGFIFLSLIF